MAKIDIKGKDGKSVGSLELSEKLSGATASEVSVHRAVVSEESASRQGTQSAKTRSEVRGGGRKPYKQKKTGNARQGSINSPHYRHGGMALAVKPRDYDKKINKKERRASILAALAGHIAAGNVSVVDNLSFAEPKTKDAVAFLAALGLKDQRRVLVITTEYDPIAYKSFRNLPDVVVRTAPAGKTAEGAEATKTVAFSTRDVMLAQKIVIAKDALARIEEVWAK
jgi:large subunit ribosomal protein L4